MTDELTLTSAEVEEIKDQARFKERTTLTLKHVCKKLDALNGITGDVKSLKETARVHWRLILLILGGLGGLAFSAFVK